MGYVANTDNDRSEMLSAIGIKDFEELLAQIPAHLRFVRPLDLALGQSEIELMARLKELAGLNENMETHACFLGAGSYDHFRPAVVAALASRGEFLTSYTPYQPELSQGMLQAIYEYQTLICALTNMEVANASMYDAATGLAEAALMACALTGRKRVLVSIDVHPHFREVLKTYLFTAEREMLEAPSEQLTGLLVEEGSDVAAVLFQHPNFLGALEDVAIFAAAARSAGALTVAAVDPISLGLLKPPGDFGIDIVVGEGQPLGIPMGCGGPLLGFFACKKRFIRHLPGRLVGAAVDSEGRRGYTMTLRTREQDIRREKATSNICTNQALMALYATIYLCQLGKSGLREAAELCVWKSHYLRDGLLALDGVESVTGSRPFFREFAVTLPGPAAPLLEALRDEGIEGGLSLERLRPDLPCGLLVCVTENRTREQLDRYLKCAAGVLGGAR